MRLSLPHFNPFGKDPGEPSLRPTADRVADTLKTQKPLLRVGTVFQSGLDLHFEQVAVDRAGDFAAFDDFAMRVSGRSVRFCRLSGAFLTSVEVPIERRAVDTKLFRHLTC